VIQHQTSFMLLCIISLLLAVYTLRGKFDLFYANCTNQFTVRSVACNILCQEGGCSEAIRSVARQSRNDILYG
jgi:hypothetical protein